MAPTFAFIVIATREQPWQRILRKGQVETWFKKLLPNEKFLAVYSDGSLGKSQQDPTNHQRLIFENSKKLTWDISEPIFFEENHASFSGHSGYGGLVPATVSAMSYLRTEYDPDYIIRTNVSSYWNIAALRSLLTTLPKYGVYAGVTGDTFGRLTGLLRNAKYVSGAGMILSRDVYTEMISSREKFDITWIDDLSIGRTLANLKIKSMSMDRIDIRHLWDINQIPSNMLRANVHFRCKSVHRVGALEIRRDVSLMRRLHSMIERINE